MTIYHTLPETPLEGPSSVAVGVFDGVHTGHKQVVEAAKQPGLSTVVLALEGCRKGARRLMVPQDKAQILSSLGVDVLCTADLSEVQEFSPEEFIDRILLRLFRAGRVACGFNFHFGKNAAGSAQDLTALCAARGIEAAVVPAVRQGGEPVSSTRIRALIEAGDIPAASALLGRPYGFTLPVSDGDKRGRTLGAPTINQHFPADFLLPRFGVYASFAEVGGKRYPAVTNIGVRPTVRSPYPLAETYLLGFSGDLYGRPVRVSLLRFLRGEQKFSSLNELKAAIARDAESASHIFRQMNS